jgi:hypothetical protein
VVGISHLFLLVAESAEDVKESYKGVVEEELTECKQGKHQVKGDVELEVKFVDHSLKVGEIHRKNPRVNIGITNQHPFPDKWTAN